MSKTDNTQNQANTITDKPIKVNYRTHLPLASNPELLDFLTDFQILRDKWTASKIAGTLGVTRQALNYQKQMKLRGKK